MRKTILSHCAGPLRRIFILACLIFLASAVRVQAGGSGPNGGHPCAPQGNPKCGDPISIGTGNLFEEATDYESGGQNRLELKRYFNSQDYYNVFPTFGNWRSNYDSFIFIGYYGESSSTVDVILPDNKSFNLENTDGGTGPADLEIHLNIQGDCTSTCTYSVTDWNQTVRVYGFTQEYDSGTFLRLTQIIYRNGYTQTVQYAPCDSGYICQVAAVTDSYGRTLTFNYQSIQGTNPPIYVPNSVTTPDGEAINYTFSNSGADYYIQYLYNLASVTYPTPTPATLNYLYQDGANSGLLTGIVDEDGNNFASWTYDDNSSDASSGFALTSQNAGGVNLTTLTYPGPFTYTSGINMPLPQSVTVTNALGLQSTYNFGKFTTTNSGNVPINSSIQRPATATTAAATSSTTYDSNGYIESQTDWNGNITKFTNDSRGNITSLTQGYGTAQATTTTSTYLSTFDLPVTITEPDRTTTFTYDANGNMLTKKVTAANTSASTWTFTYNATGEVLTATDPLDNKTTYAYDTQGNLTTVSNALNQVTSFTSYDANGRPLTIESPNGLVTTLTYNFMGQVTSKTEGSWVTSYTYDPAWQLIQITRPDASYLIFTYDAAHRLTRVTDTLGNYVTYTLDAAGNKTSEQVYNNGNVLKSTHSNSYDVLSRMIQSTGAQNQTAVLAYDANGNLISFTDPLGDATTRVFDSINRLIQSTDPKGGKTSFAYDTQSRLTSVTDPRSLATTYAYNGFDEVTTLSSHDTGSSTNTYDAAGNIISSTDALGKKTTYAYDALNRLTSQTLANGNVMTYTYDAGGGHNIGYLTSMKDSASSTSWTYNVHGMAVTKQLTIGSTVLTTSQSFNTTTGQRMTMTYPSGTTLLYSYDTDGRVSNIAVQAAGSSSPSPLVSDLTYRAMGPVTSWTAANGTSFSRSFDQDNRIVTLSLPGSDAISLTYDVASRITGINETGLGAKSFEYNKQNRLTSFSNGTTSQIYTYDLSGNRISYSDSASSTSLTYTYPTTSNRLTSVSGSSSESYTYDANGNILTHKTPSADYSFSFSVRKRLSQATVGATSTVYAYDGLDQRVEKTYPSQSGVAVLFTYDDMGNLIGKYAANGTLQTETVWLGDLPVALIQPGATYYVAPDHLSSPHEITNAAGQIVWFWDHDPWGVAQPTGSFINRQLFPGQFQDTETGLDYNFYRDYDPKTGRYIESDPLGLKGGDTNTYGYVSGDPLGYVDPNGTFPLFIATATAGFAFGLVGNIAGQLISNNGNVNCINYRNALIAGGVGAVSGALAPFAAISPLTAMALGGASNLGQYAATQYASGDKLTAEGAIWAAGTGALGGAVSGAITPVTKYVTAIFSKEGGWGPVVGLIERPDFANGPYAGNINRLNTIKGLLGNTVGNVDIPGTTNCPQKCGR